MYEKQTASIATCNSEEKPGGFSCYHFRKVIHFNEVGNVSLSVIKIPWKKTP